MSFWDKISNATKRPAGMPGMGGAAAAVSGRWHRIKPWVFVGLAVGLVLAIWSGQAKVAAVQFEVQLLGLLPIAVVVLALVAVLGILLGFTFLKAPAEHALAKYGRRLIWVAPLGLVVAMLLIPTVATALSLTSSGVAELEKSYLGQKQAASLCTAAGLTDPAPAPTPHR